MPVADRKLIGWTVVIYIVSAVAVCGTTTYTCHAPSEYGVENIVICNVTYTDTLVLECPDQSQKAALWRKNSSNIICSGDSGPKCTLNVNRNLTNQDSGIYFCRIPTANGTDFHQFYVKVNILAPPSLLGVEYCNNAYNSSSCTYPALIGGIREDFTVTVAWGGMGPFSVQWKHNGSDFKCQTPECEPKQSANKMSLVFHAKPHPDDFPGVYSANISNSYGWNMSHTDVIIDRCQDLDHPVFLSHNSSRALTDGSGVRLVCNLTYSIGAWLTVCFGKFDQSLSDFTNGSINDQYCTFCPPRGSGYCGSLPQNPSWEVHKEEEGPCKETAANVIAIRNFAKEDEGRILCFYGDDDNPYKLYTTHTLTYKSYTLYIAIGVVCTCVVILITVVAFIFWRKKKPKSQDSDSPISPGIIVQEAYTWSGPRPHRSQMCRRGGGECAPLLIPRPPATPGGSVSSSDSRSSYGSNESSTPQETDYPEQVPSDFLTATERNDAVTLGGSVSSFDFPASHGSNESTTPQETDYPEQVQSDFLTDTERNGQAEFV